MIDSKQTSARARKDERKRRGDVGNALHALQTFESVERDSRTSGDELEERDTFLVAERPDRAPEVADDRVRVRKVDEVCNRKKASEVSFRRLEP